MPSTPANAMRISSPPNPARSTSRLSIVGMKPARDIVPLPSAPFRFATLTSTTRWGGGQNKTPTTNRKRKVPNLFQDLTFRLLHFQFQSDCHYLALGRMFEGV